MITAEEFHRVTAALGQQGLEDIAWADGCCRPDSADEMALEIIFVIANSGMKNTVARGIYKRVSDALIAGGSAHDAFGHKGKAGAMDAIWRRRERLFSELGAIKSDTGLLDWCGGLPWIGGITKYHVAKNFGADVAKPDVHLQRLADREGVSAQQLCERIACETGHTVRAVDTVLWRACANGVINSKTGEVHSR